MSKNNSANNSGAHNVIAAGTKVIGKIESVENFRIDGEIEGDIECKGKIIVGQSSTVNGNVFCDNLELLGCVKGNITCQDTIIFRRESQLQGDLVTQVIEIEQGAFFTGNIKMLTNDIK